MSDDAKDAKTKSEAAMTTIDLRLIPEFSGSLHESIVEWFDKVEFICELRGLKDSLTTIVPLKLTGSAFAVYKHLSEEKRKNIEEVKKTLIAAFSADAFKAYEQFAARQLRPGEAPDVYLAHLEDLAERFGGVPEKALACAFVVGLPDAVRWILRAGTRLESLTLEEMLQRTRAVMVEDRDGVGAVAVGRSRGGFVVRGQQRRPRGQKLCVLRVW